MSRRFYHRGYTLSKPSKLLLQQFLKSSEIVYSSVLEHGKLGSRQLAAPRVSWSPPLRDSSPSYRKVETARQGLLIEKSSRAGPSKKFIQNAGGRGRSRKSVKSTTMAPETKTPAAKKDPRAWDALTPPLAEWILDAISSMGFARMTPVQAAVLPLFMTNKE